MQTKSRAWTLLSWIAVASPWPALAELSPGLTINPGCTLEGNHYNCSMIHGVAVYRIDFDRDKGYLVEHLQIHNDSGGHLQINSVDTYVTVGVWQEICVSLDEAATSQTVPGRGEVGCIDKAAGLLVYPTLSWDSWGLGRALAVPPTSTVFMGTNADALLAQGVDTSSVYFVVSTAPQTQGVLAFRQPRADQSIACNGANQWTTWSPWRNNEGRVWRTEGATIYSVAPAGNQVDVACIYVLNTAGLVRWSHCANVNQRGRVSYPQQVIQPGEYLAGQARHRCSAPGLWDWAAYVHVWY
jgi:hypothetical protein